MPITSPKAKDHPALSPELKRTLCQAAHADAVAAVAAPTMAEFNAFVTSYNGLLAKLRLAGIIG